jgi:hypothetical protein
MNYYHPNQHCSIPKTKYAMFFQSNLQEANFVPKAITVPILLAIRCTSLLNVQSTVNEAEFDISQMNE